MLLGRSSLSLGSKLKKKGFGSEKLYYKIMSIKIEKWESERTHGTQIAQHIHLHFAGAAWI